MPVGGTWIEPDCNIPSGESLLRQFLHGQRYFEQRFGRRCTEFWNPDVFGYNGQLPQIMREGGVDRFLTQKLSWNRFNRPEHHTFIWQGIDGSEVLAHFPPADTYTSAGTVAELRKSARAYKDHEHSRTSMLVYGYGDGGGGPTREMIETMLRARDLQGLPRTRMAAPDGALRGARGRAWRAADDPRRALLRVPPRHVHDPGAHEARQPTLRRSRSTTRSSSRPPQAAITRARSSTACGSFSSCSSSTTSSPARRSGSSTRTPSATSPRSRPARTRSRRRRSRLSAAAR